MLEDSLEKALIVVDSPLSIEAWLIVAPEPLFGESRYSSAL